MLNLILFGPPGSGKGTQAEMISKKYRLKHLSTGDILRNEIKNETPLGREAKKFIDEGMLVPDEVVIGMIGEALDEHSGQVDGFLFDGFPRTIAQAKALDKLLDFKHTTIAGVLALDVSEEEITKRILKRGETSGRSDDSDEATIRKRFQEYMNKTSPVAGYYAKQDKLAKLHGEGGIEAIFGMLCGKIDAVA
jgi:adenylate kinase